MSDQASVQEQKAPEEAQVSGVISWLIGEFETIDQSAITTKEEKITEAANRLKELGLKPKGIAAELARHAKELHVARSWIYEVLPVEYKRKERSDAIKEARKPMSSGGHSANDGERRGAVPGGPLGGSRPDKTLTQETLLDIVNEVIQAAEQDGDSYRVPKDVFDKLVMAAPRVA